MHTCMCGSVLSFLLGQCLGVDLLGHVAILGLTVGGASTVFHSGCPSSHPPAACEVPVSPHPRWHLLSSIMFIRAVLLSVESCLIVALVCIPLMTDDVAPTLMCLRAFLYFL